MDDLAASRRELERRAFGRPESDADAHEALLELESLNQQAARSRSDVAPADAPKVDAAAQAAASEDEPVATSAPSRYRRPLLIGLSIVMLLLGGVAIGRASAGVGGRRAGDAPSPTASGLAGVTPEFFLANDPNGVSITEDMDAWFSSKQEPSDDYSGVPSRGLFVASSTRLAESSSILGKVWIARGVASNDVCLMSKSAPDSNGETTGSVGCVSLKGFAKDGLTITNEYLTVNLTLGGIQIYEKD